MPRAADDVLIGGGRVFLDGQDIGWLQGEMSLEEQGDALTVKESEGGTVVSIQNDQEVHFTCIYSVEKFSSISSCIIE